jgi:hypothetical protein
MIDMLGLGMLAVGNDSDTTAQYGGTGHAGDVGTMHKDKYGIDTSMGVGRRMAKVLASLNTGERLADAPRVLFLVLQDADGLADANALLLGDDARRSHAAQQRWARRWLVDRRGREHEGAGAAVEAPAAHEPEAAVGEDRARDGDHEGPKDIGVVTASDGTLRERVSRDRAEHELHEVATDVDPLELIRTWSPCPIGDEQERSLVEVDRGWVATDPESDPDPLEVGRVGDDVRPGVTWLRRPSALVSDELTVCVYRASQVRRLDR